MSWIGIYAALCTHALVALHDARREEERRGSVRWIRPDFQAPRFGGTWAGEADELGLTVGTGVLSSRPAWPGTVIEQIAALKTLADATPVSAEAATTHFAGARRDLVVRHLDTLAIMGELRQLPDGAYSGITAAV